MLSSKDRRWEEIRIDDELPPLNKEITQEIINRYAAASEDPNPLHTDPEFAKTTPFKGTIAHGNMYLAYVSEMMMQWFPHQWITGGLMEVSFLGPARPGDTLRLSGRVSEKVVQNGGREIVFNIACETQAGKKVVVGTAKVIWE